MSMTLVLALALGAAIGLTLGVIGGGGAILAVPVLVAVLDQDAHMATTSSLVVVGAAALVAGLRHAKARHVCWRVAAVFTVAAIPGAILGTLANGVAGGRLLLSLLAVLILAVAYLTWRRAATPATGAPEPPPTCPAVPVLPLAATGVGIGVLTGFFGVGGGFVIVPALAIVLQMPFRLAIGTSLIIIFMVSLTAFVNHMVAGADVDWSTTLPFAAATVGGSLMGAQIAPRFSQEALGKAFAILLVGVAVMTFAIA
jgi:uncharacterized membrane protein YfcA